MALYHCDGTSEQEWILEKVPYNTPSHNTGLIQIKNGRYPNLCLDVQWGTYEKGTKVWLYNCWSYTDKKIESQLFDVTYSFYYKNYYSGSLSLGRISIEAFFERGNSMLSTWIRPFFSGGQFLILEIEGGYTNGRLQLWTINSNIDVHPADITPAYLTTNKIFSLVSVE